MAYAGVFRLTNVPDTGTQQMILLIQAPHMLFPFVRRIVADVVRDGGMPPLMIEPIDFVALYQARVAQARRPAAPRYCLKGSRLAIPERFVAQFLGDKGGMALAVSAAVISGASFSGRWRAARTTVSVSRGGDFHRRQHQPALPPADQFQIDFRRQLGVQQRAMLGARRQVDAEALAQFVQRIARAGNLALGDLDRVDRRATAEGARGRRGQVPH